MVEICYERLVLWLVGVYASNVSQERKLLWRSLNSMIDDGRPGLLMGDFNVCCETNQSTSVSFLWWNLNIVGIDFFHG